jgi:rfaE bifunctional protein kinase chain/domain
MKARIKNKIIPLNTLIRKVANLKAAGKTIVQSHGIFDLIHPGITQHLNEAKNQGDILIVTVIKDKDIRRGSGRPIFSEELRVENVASLEQVDYACVVDDEHPFECVKRIKPDIFAKGQSYKERDRKIHEKIFEEEKEFYFEKSKIYETGGFSFSSSQIINNFLDIYPEDTKSFLKNFAQKYSFHDILDQLNHLKKLRVLLIGDGIIDEYHYCESMEKSAKSPLVVHKYIADEIFAGGAFIIANNVAGLCNEVQLVTLLGKEESREYFILNNLKPNVKAKFFYRQDGPTICKKRFINQYLNQKLFEINYLNDNYINENLELSIANYLKVTIPEYDLILISDFGHGFITNKIIKVIERYAKIFAVNTQTNAANAGYNLITKYQKPNFVCLDETEARLTTQERFSNIEDVAKNISEKVDADYFIITLGKRGSIGINREKEINRTPVFSTKVVDTVGAGDAFFAFTAPCFAQHMSLDLVSFIGNAVGALAVQIVGNKKNVEKYELLELIHTILQ